MNWMKGSSISRQEKSAYSLVWRWTITGRTPDLSHQTVKGTNLQGNTGDWGWRFLFSNFYIFLLHWQATSLPLVPPEKPIISFSSKENGSVFSHKQEFGKHAMHVSLLEKHLKRQDKWRASPGGPGVKDPPSSAWGVGSVPGQGAKTPQVLRPEKPNHEKEATWEQIQ